MKYFFLAYAIVAALVIGLMPVRGEKRASTPIWLFPDMDNQDKLKAQKPDDFFADGVGERMPVDGTQPRGFLPEGEAELGGIPEYQFGGGTSYYETGAINDHYSSGMPEELGLTEENVDAFLRRGHEMFLVNCMPCHGASGNGQGMAAQFGVPGVANLQLENFGPAAYPDGRMFETITHGKGNMGSYKHNVSLRDRWAIIAYVRALQAAQKAPMSDPAVKAAYDAAQASANPAQ
ncbi:c-type cytochrome [Haloferula sargassicola]|uniref:Cytochrome c domain-containing protein n=1 Tax=Haloferula sargassicola TaxID=490096 RepID=A0ABP9UN73_9BACT